MVQVAEMQNQNITRCASNSLCNTTFKRVLFFAYNVTNLVANLYLSEIELEDIGYNIRVVVTQVHTGRIGFKALTQLFNLRLYS